MYFYGGTLSVKHSLTNLPPAREGRGMKRHKPQEKPHRTRGPSKFRKTEATRLVRAALDAGLSINRVECDPAGKLSVIAGKAPSTSDDPMATIDERQLKGLI